MDEIMAAHKKNVVLAALVRKLNVKGKKGDTVKLPKPTRGSAAAKSANTIVTTLIASGGASVTVSLTAHFEYSRLIEDIAEVHALSSMRKFYTDDAGYALAVQKDSSIFNAARTLNGGDGASTWTGGVIAGDGTTAFVDAGGNANATAITDAGIRRVIQVLDDNDIPMSDRALVIPPVGRRIMMGLARFTEQAFVGDGKTIRNGKLGDVYGVSVHVTSNCPTPTSATTAKVGLLTHRDALILAEVLGPRVQTQYKQEYLATLLTADTIYGVAEAYDKGGIAMVMPG
jgi:N4-gp56 family major capsid protein